MAWVKNPDANSVAPWASGPKIEFTKCVWGVLSPLLSKILLDDLDKELEKRSHCFCRYADDCNIYVRTRQSDERVMASLKRYLEKKLRLKVNEAKSRVDRPWNCKFLGYSMTVQRRPRLQAAVRSVERFKVQSPAALPAGAGPQLGALHYGGSQPASSRMGQLL